MLRAHAPFGPYEIRRRLGAGGMGEVYLAFDSRLHREVAIKVLHGDRGSDRSRILREARMAAALRHPNICTVFEAGEIDGQPFVAMEHIEGRSLASIAARGPLGAEQVAAIGSQIADGLAAAHRQGLVHRDLKPANVLVDATGRVSILDFGIAERTSDLNAATMTRTSGSAGGFAGTLAYMAPEVLRGGPAEARGDIWSLGVVLFELTTGRRPFASDQPYELASSILSGDAPRLPDSTAPALRAIVERCLTRDPAERYQTAAEVRSALDAIRAGTASASGSSGRRRGALWYGSVAAAIAVIVALLIVRGWRSNGAMSERRVRAIAVLPLTNLSGDSGQDFFADGMTEALITDLARVKGLDVISRSSVMQYRAAPKPIPEIARALGVDVVVEGSVIRAGDRVRITAQLIDGASDRHLWANDYDRDVRDVLALQHDVARAIANEIRATLAPPPESTAARRIDPIAHEKYLKGRALVFRYNEASIAQAIDLLQEALKLEPGFADAWAALASAHSERGIWGQAGSRETSTRAREAITRALALDPNSSEAYATLANINTVYDWQWAAAESAARRAIDLAPGSARAHQVYAAVLQATRRFAEAVEEARAFRRLDPASPLAASTVGRTLYRASRFDEAIAAFNEAIALDPTYGPNYARLADVYIAMGQYDRAIEVLDKGRSVLGSSRRQNDGYGVAYALSGRVREAETVLSELIEQAPTRDQLAYSIAMVETALGRHDDAIRWLNRAYEQRSATLFLVNGELKLEPLRADPRFQDLLKRMGFTDSGRTASRTAP